VNIKDDDIDKKYTAIRKDLSYIKKTYGEVFDYCGSFCNCEQFEVLLKTPNKKTALKISIAKLKCYFSTGYENNVGNNQYKKLNDAEDKKLEIIKKRWNLQ
jgi:hypothetical protein